MMTEEEKTQKMANSFLDDLKKEGEIIDAMIDVTYEMIQTTKMKEAEMLSDMYLDYVNDMMQCDDDEETLSYKEWQEKHITNK